MLGLFLVEWAQRFFFPGETSGWLKVLGRTRCREGRLGGPDPWAALSLFTSGESEADAARGLPSPIDFHDPTETERHVRSQLMETEDPVRRAGWLILLAEIGVRGPGKSDPLPILNEASNVLWKSWSPLSEEFRSAFAQVLRMKAVYLLRGAKLDELRSLLGECGSVFGGQDWVRLLRAETGLLLGNFEEVRSGLAAFMPESKERTSPHTRSKALLLVAESYLGEHAYESLDWTLRQIDYRDGFIEEGDRLVYSRLRIESALHHDRPEVAWRYLSVLHEASRRSPQHAGKARQYHLACARMHTEELSFQEAHRRLQLAENLSLYPVARWEVDVIMGGLLEREERAEEALNLWEHLSAEATGTYFGQIAQARVSRYRAEDPRYQLQMLLRRP